MLEQVSIVSNPKPFILLFRKSSTGSWFSLLRFSIQQRLWVSLHSFAHISLWPLIEMLRGASSRELDCGLSALHLQQKPCTGQVSS